LAHDHNHTTRRRARFGALAEIKDREQSRQGCAVSHQRFDQNYQNSLTVAGSSAPSVTHALLCQHVFSQLQMPDYIESLSDFEKDYLKNHRASIPQAIGPDWASLELLLFLKFVGFILVLARNCLWTHGVSC
jgi:hypothetical protein